MTQKFAGSANTRKICLLAASITLAISACSQPKPKSQVTVDPPSLKVERLKEVTLKNAVVDASLHQVGSTDWAFSVFPEIDFSIKDEKKEKDGYHIWIEITGAKLHLALPIKTFLSDKAPQFVLDHENGHAEICRRIYKNARQYAMEAIKSVVGKKIEGFGADRKEALSNAIQMAGQDISSPYRGSTSGLADRVSSMYDQLCEKEDRQKLVEKTVNDAFLAVENEDKQKKKAP